MKFYIISIPNLIGEQRVIGPFDSIESAKTYGAGRFEYLNEWSVVQLGGEFPDYVTVEDPYKDPQCTSASE